MSNKWPPPSKADDNRREAVNFPRRIWLFGDGDEVVWCDDPAPNINQDADDSVEYIRHDAGAAHADSGELGQLRVQLAGCGCEALGYGENVQPGDYGWSESLGDVRRMRLRREQAEHALAEVRELAEQIIHDRAHYENGRVQENAETAAEFLVLLAKLEGGSDGWEGPGDGPAPEGWNDE